MASRKGLNKVIAIKDNLARVLKHEGVIGYIILKKSAGQIHIISRLPFYDEHPPLMFAGIPIQSTLSPGLTLQYAHLTTSIVTDVRNLQHQH